MILTIKSPNNGVNQKFQYPFLYYFEGLTPKNDPRTKIKSNKPTISSENVIV